MRLKLFTWSVIGLALIVLLSRVFLNNQGEALTYFGITMILLGSGFELVRIELERLKSEVGKGKP